MTEEFQLPKEGIKIFSPDAGWHSASEQSGPDETGSASSQREGAPDGRAAGWSDAMAEAMDPLPQDSWAGGEDDEPMTVGDHDGDHQAQLSPGAHDGQAFPASTGPMAASGQSAQVSHLSSPHAQAAALAEVGDSLHSLFVALQQPAVPSDVVEAGLSWRDVADQSRNLEDLLVQRMQLLDQLSLLERDIRLSREELLDALRSLAHQEQRNLESATMRASISSLAANVIAKKFSI